MRCTCSDPLVEADRANAVSTGAAKSPTSESIAETAAIETVKAAAASPGTETEESVAAAADEGQEAAVAKAGPGASRAANAGAAGTGIAPLGNSTGLTP